MTDELKDIVIHRFELLTRDQQWLLYHMLVLRWTEKLRNADPDLETASRQFLHFVSLRQARENAIFPPEAMPVHQAQ